MRILSRLKALLESEHRRPVIQRNDAIRAQLDRVVTESERAIDLIDDATGIWHQDMIEGAYRGQPHQEARHG